MRIVVAELYRPDAFPLTQPCQSTEEVLSSGSLRLKLWCS